MPSDKDERPPIRNLRKREERPPSGDADKKAQGARLIAARRKFFKTASMAARALGIAGPTYLAHENGTRQIRGDVAIFYGEHFNVSPDWLLLNKGDGPSDVTVSIVNEKEVSMQPPPDVSRDIASIHSVLVVIEEVKRARPLLSASGKRMLLAGLDELRDLLSKEDLPGTDPPKDDSDISQRPE